MAKSDKDSDEGLPNVAFRSKTQAEAAKRTAPLVIKTKRLWGDGRVLPKHAWIPDVQAKEGVPIEHLRWAGLYLCEKKPDVIILAMDWWDYPSLSRHDKEKADYRTRSVMRDFRAGLHAWDTFFEPIRAERKKSGWSPTIVCVEGNHDALIWRHLQEDARVDTACPTPRQVAEAEGCLWYPFLTPVEIDGVSYCHYFANPMTGFPYSGMMESRLKTVGHSFTMGHQQTYLTGVRYLGNGTVQRGLVAGAFYQHDEAYRNPQANLHWRGILIKHGVKNGNYNLMEVDIPFLKRRYGSPRITAKGNYREKDLSWSALLAKRTEAVTPAKKRHSKK